MREKFENDPSSRYQIADIGEIRKILKMYEDIREYIKIYKKRMKQYENTLKHMKIHDLLVSISVVGVWTCLGCLEFHSGCLDLNFGRLPCSLVVWTCIL